MNLAALYVLGMVGTAMFIMVTDEHKDPDDHTPFAGRVFFSAAWPLFVVLALVAVITGRTER